MQQVILWELQYYPIKGKEVLPFISADLNNHNQQGLTQHSVETTQNFFLETNFHLGQNTSYPQISRLFSCDWFTKWKMLTVFPSVSVVLLHQNQVHAPSAPHAPAPRGTFAMSGNISGCYTWGSVTGTWWAETEMLPDIVPCTGKAPNSKMPTGQLCWDQEAPLYLDAKCWPQATFKVRAKSRLKI